MSPENRETLNESRFQEHLQIYRRLRSDSDRLADARQMMIGHTFSSAQIKVLCTHLGDDNARLDLATEAYPHVVDPENFHDVYDAFTTLSKVMRLLISRPETAQRGWLTISAPGRTDGIVFWLEPSREFAGARRA